MNVLKPDEEKEKSEQVTELEAREGELTEEETKLVIEEVKDLWEDKEWLEEN